MSFDLYQVEKVAFNTSQTRRASLKCSWAKVPPAAAQGQLDFPKKISLPFVKTLFSYFLYFSNTLFGGRKAEICRRKTLGGQQPIRGCIFSEKQKKHFFLLHPLLFTLCMCSDAIVPHARFLQRAYLIGADFHNFAPFC